MSLCLTLKLSHITPHIPIYSIPPLPRSSPPPNSLPRSPPRSPRSLLRSSSQNIRTPRRSSACRRECKTRSTRSRSSSVWPSSSPKRFNTTWCVVDSMLTLFLTMLKTALHFVFAYILPRCPLTMPHCHILHRFCCIVLPLLSVRMCRCPSRRQHTSKALPTTRNTTKGLRYADPYGDNSLPQFTHYPCLRIHFPPIYLSLPVDRLID